MACVLQKEPKLVRARQIPEWDIYDREIATFAGRVSEGGGALAVSVDDLAAEKVVESLEAGLGAASNQAEQEQDYVGDGRIIDEL